MPEQVVLTFKSGAQLTFLVTPDEANALYLRWLDVLRHPEYGVYPYDIHDPDGNVIYFLVGEVLALARLTEPPEEVIPSA